MSKIGKRPLTQEDVSRMRQGLNGAQHDLLKGLLDSPQRLTLRELELCCSEDYRLLGWTRSDVRGLMTKGLVMVRPRASGCVVGCDDVYGLTSLGKEYVEWLRGEDESCSDVAEA